MNILIVSTYELGHQPFGLAHPAALLRRLGFKVRTLDLAIQRFDSSAFRSVDLIAFYLPMHTATRLAVPLIVKAKQLNPQAHIAAFGLYAPLNKAYLRSLGVITILGGEFEPELIALSQRLADGFNQENPAVKLESSVPQQNFVIPDRSGLPALSQYAHLQLPDDQKRTVGYTESSRGCKHWCRHCPVVPIYKGRFRAIPRNIVLADIRQQVEAGAQHITFGDPDFLNGPTHCKKIVNDLHKEFPQLTYDVTIKVEHLLAHKQLLPILKTTGCLFVTTAVESVDDQILAVLEKGHTRDDFFQLVDLMRDIGLDIAPTFVPFTPWTTLHHYLELLKVVFELDLVQSVVPVQLSIRLLIPPGSLLMETTEIRSLVGPLDEQKLIYPWKNPDPRVDQLQKEVQTLVQHAGEKPRDRLFKEIWNLAHDLAGIAAPVLPNFRRKAGPAQLSEPWYCCAEPTENQFRLL